MLPEGPLRQLARRVADLARHPALAIALGAALLSVAVLILIRDVGEDSEPQAPELGGGEVSMVVRAERDLPRGTSTEAALAEGDLAILPAPSDPPSGSVTAASQLNGRVLDQDIAEGDIVLTSQLRAPTAREDAQVEIPNGTEAVALTLPFTAAGGGYVGAGDRVNLYAVVGGPDRAVRVGASILVLDVSTELAPYSGDEPRPVAPSITYLLAVPHQEVSPVMLLDAAGRIRLSIVNPGDDPVPGPASSQLDELLAALTLSGPPSAEPEGEQR